MNEVMPIVRRSPILGASGRPMHVEVRRSPRLSELERTGIDAAATGRLTDKHFNDANGRPLSAVLSEDLPIVRDRLRYETRNNGNAKGMIDTLVTAVVGIGPTLQVHTGNPELDKIIEAEFADFAEDCDFADRDVSIGDMMSLGVREQCVAGEDFLTWTTDHDYPGQVKLRLQTIAPERLATPWNRITDPNIKDGIEFDDRNRKVRYHVSKGHPKDTSAKSWKMYGKSETVEVADMIHSFVSTESGQHRGYPWFTPALPEMAGLRRYALAVLSAAETAADISFVIQTNSAFNGEMDIDEQKNWEAMDEIQLARHAGMVMPAGYGAFQFDPKQPSVSYAEYMRERKSSMGRPLGMPYNIAAADSKGQNFASGRLDHQMFLLFVLTIRNRDSRRKLKPIFGRWLNEARRVNRWLFPLNSLDVRKIIRTSEWYFRMPTVHGDPVKEQKAITESLHNGSATFIDVCAERGMDWEVQLEKENKVALKRLELAAERKKQAAKLGLTPDEASAALSKKPAIHTNEDRDEENEDEVKDDKKKQTIAA